jgi:hypothetical protein
MSQNGYTWNTNNGDDALKFGIRSLVYSGIQIVKDKYLPATTIYILDTSKFALDEGFSEGWNFVTNESGHSLRLREDYDIFQSRAQYLGNIMCRRPDAQGALVNFPTAIV